MKEAVTDEHRSIEVVFFLSLHNNDRRRSAIDILLSMDLWNAFNMADVVPFKG